MDTRGNDRQRRGLGLLAVAGLGLIAWIAGLALMQSDALSTVGTLVGLVGMLAVSVGLVGGLGLLALDRLRRHQEL